jgi:hypothetical protein
MKYNYQLAHSEDFVEASDQPTEGINNEKEGSLALARINDNPDGDEYVLLRSDESSAWVLEKKKWVKYG